MRSSETHDMQGVRSFIASPCVASNCAGKPLITAWLGVRVPPGPPSSPSFSSAKPGSWNSHVISEACLGLAGNTWTDRRVSSRFRAILAQASQEGYFRFQVFGSVHRPDPGHAFCASDHFDAFVVSRSSSQGMLPRRIQLERSSLLRSEKKVAILRDRIFRKRVRPPVRVERPFRWCCGAGRRRARRGRVSDACSARYVLCKSRRRRFP